MKKDIILGLLRHVLTSVGSVLVARGMADDSQVAEAAGAVCALLGLAWSVWQKRQAAGRCGGAGMVVAAVGLVVVLGLSGCGVPGKHGQIMTVSTWFVGARVQATSSSSGTPEVWMGMGRQTVTYAPTSTNGPVYAPRYGATFNSEQTAWNPLTANTTENVFMGDVMVGTNSEGSAIVPKFPVKAPAGPVGKVRVP